MVTLPRSERHPPGIGRLCYTPDGSLLYSAGADGLIRVFSARPEDDSDEQKGLIEQFEGAVLSMDASMESLVVGDEDGKVSLYQHGSNEFSSFVTEIPLGLSVRAVKFSPNGHRVAVASDQLEVKVIDVRDVQKIQLLEGHTKSVRAVSWSPDGQLITTSGSDGTIRVWDVSNPNEPEPSCIQVIDGVLAEVEVESELQCQAVWHPSGRYFVIGSKGHEIAVISRETWEREGEFSRDGHNGAITTLSFSPNGRYMCSSAADKRVLVWDCTSRKVIDSVTNEEGEVSDLAWRFGAGSNSIAFIDNLGYVSRWHNTIPSDLPHPNDAPQNSRDRRSAGPESKKQNTDLFQLDADDMDLAMGDDRPVGTGENLDDEDDFIEDDDDDAVYTSRYKTKLDDDSLPPPLAGRRHGSVVVASSSSARGSSLIKGQEVFQPGATPSKDKRRYLALNTIGSISIVERDTHNIVNIDFHDQTSHTSTHFDDYSKYSIGCLGENGAAYAQNGRSTASVVAYRPFQTWESSTSGDWSFEFPAGEEATAIAIGGIAAATSEEGVEDLDNVTGTGRIVAATSRNFLRFFSGAGHQTYIMSLGEQVVSMSAGNEWLLVIHRPHELITPGRQDLNYTILDLDSYEVIQRGKVPLAKNATLRWIGFSAENLPCIYDSTGLLSVLDRARRPMQARWVPLLDTNTLARREGKQESYWPIGVNDASFMCIILKGEEKHPYFPTPITQDLPIQLPVLKIEEPIGEAEAKLLQATLLATNARDALPASTSSYTEETYALKAKAASYEVEMDKSVLKLIQLACKNEKHQQALDLGRLLNTSKALAGAAKIANLYSMSGVASRFETMQDAKDGLYGREKADQKRDSKYAHLVDSRTIPVAATGQLPNSRDIGRQGPNPLSMPFETSAKPKKTAKTVFSDMPAPKAKPVQRDSVIAHGNGGDSDDEPMHYDDADDGQSVRQDSVMPMDSSMPPSSMPIRQPFNPFAKNIQMPKSSSVAASSQAGPSNPFAKKPVQNGNNALKKTGSFFDRVDASNGLTPAGSHLTKSTSAGGSGKQSTLFGLPPASKEATEKKSNRGRKRKSDTGADSQGAGNDDDDEDSVEVTSIRKQPKSLKSFFGKNTSSSGVDKQKNKKSRSSDDGLDDVVAARDASLELSPEEDETQEVATATQEDEEVPSMEGNTSNESLEAEASGPVTPAAENDTVFVEEPSEMDAASPPKKQDSMSKLASFKFSARDASTVETA